MHLSKKAQSTLEYCAIAIFVIIGILVMGPYIIRSINAYFQGTKESIKESYLEEIEQAPITQIP
jgi:hypothetical protein